MLQQETAELFSAFISQRSISFKPEEEDFLDNYQKVYNLINSQDSITE